jgi:hypothetical protein
MRYGRHELTSEPTTDDNASVGHLMGGMQKGGVLTDEKGRSTRFGWYLSPGKGENGSGIHPTVTRQFPRPGPAARNINPHAVSMAR